mgnify:FL=1
MSADYGCRRLFFMGKWGRGWENGFMNIFVLKLYFRLKIYFKKCKFHFQLAFFKGEDCSELRFAWKYDGSARQQLKNNFRVEFVLGTLNI